MDSNNRWYEDDDFWETMAPRMFSQKTWAAAPEETDRVVTFLGVEPPAVILDLCCGVGRHSLELTRRGFRVTGVDRTASYLKQAEKHAADDGLEIEFVREDMRRFVRDNAFDGAINLFTSFGYFEDQADDRQVLANVSRSLKSGGRFVLEMMGKEILARIFRGRDWQECEDGVLMLEERKVTKDWSWMENRWILIEGHTKHEFSISHRLYSAAELRGMLRECGFSDVIIYGDLAGAPYDHQAKRLIAVAQK